MGGRDAAADTACGGRARADRVWRRGGIRVVFLVAGAARPVCRACAAGGGELRQRLQRRSAGHGCGGAAGRGHAAGRGGGGGASGREVRQFFVFFCGVLPRPGARGGDFVVDRGRRSAVRARRLVLHRRVTSLRLPRGRRGGRLCVLRRGGGGRNRVRTDGAVVVARARGFGARRAAVVRAADDQQLAGHRVRRDRGQADT